MVRIVNRHFSLGGIIKAGRPTHVHWHYPKWPRHLEDAVHMVSDETFREIMQALRSRLAGD